MIEVRPLSDARSFGYGLSFLVRDGGRLYQYSQDDIDLIRWSFDPMHARNAHFNTDVLGARIRRLQQDFYGEGADRFLLDWELDVPRARVTWDVPPLHPGLVGVSCRRADEHIAVYLFTPP